MHIELRAKNPRIDGPIRDTFDVLLGVVATFEIRADERLLYQEFLFPVVELRVALKRWLRAGFLEHEDFEFQSMESDRPGLIWLRRATVGWRIGSIDQEYPEMRELSDSDVVSIVRDYVDTVDGWVRSECDTNTVRLLTQLD